MQLTCALIVRNESKVIERCLKSLKGAKIVILDTGSIDNTEQLCKKYTTHVYHDVWRDNFAEARNKVLSYCETPWVLSIDADEYLEEGVIRDLKDFIRKAKGNVYSVIVETDETRTRQGRLFRNCEKVYWKGVCHNYLNRDVDGDLPVHIISTSEGWGRTNDPDRALRILGNHLKQSPNSPRELYFMGKEHAARGNHEQAVYYLAEANVLYPAGQIKADICLSIGKSFVVLQRYRRAINVLYEATQLNPEMRQAWMMLYKLTKKEAYRRIAKVAKNTNLLVEYGND